MTEIIANLIRLNLVMEITGLSKSTIYRLEKINKFPRRRKIGPRAVAWVSSEIKDWVENKIEQR